MRTPMSLVEHPRGGARPLRLAAGVRQASPSAVREILKVAERPDILSFAGGLPAPELFPVKALAQAHALVFEREGESALQYSVTEGHGPLREWVAARLKGQGVQRAEAARTLVTSGAQQGIDLVARALLEPGDTVVVEDPTYLAALQVFALHQARIAAIRSDDEGMVVEDLAKLLLKRRVRLIYLVPEFHNPKGTTLSEERRRALVKLAQRHGVPIIEDNPYGELRFRGEAPPPLAALDDSGLVAHLGTFSKTLAPGMRIGWLHAGPELFRAATVVKQATDLHSSTLAQRAVAALLETFDYDAHLQRLRIVYGERCDAMLEALETHFPEGASWTRPEGGLFLWVQLPPGCRDEELFVRALERKVAFVPGHPFFVEQNRHGFIRLNFSNRRKELIQAGIQRLGEAIAK